MPRKKTTNKAAGDLMRRNVEAIESMERASEDIRTRGERVADAFAATVGSWGFIIAQSVLLAAWVMLNLIGWMKHWDPYPFILLNLALSFQAAYASPIIMMSQNRQARIGDRRNKLDLQINMLAEQENTEMLRMLRMLCQKLDIKIDSYEAALEEITEPDKIAEQIEKAAEEMKKREEAESPASDKPKS